MRDVDERASLLGTPRSDASPPEASEHAVRGVPRVRRIDPERKARILDATLEVLAEHGVAGTTHRRIAAVAGVPLAALTYHFVSLAELRAQAFARYTAAQEARFVSWFADVRTREQLIEALVGVVSGPADGQYSALLGFELHLAALRDPALRLLTQAWTDASRSVLARFTDADTAADLDALLEGLILHRLLTTEPVPRERTRAAVVRYLPPDATTAAAAAPAAP